VRVAVEVAVATADRLEVMVPVAVPLTERTRVRLAVVVGLRDAAPRVRVAVTVGVGDKTARVRVAVTVGVATARLGATVDDETPPCALAGVIIANMVTNSLSNRIYYSIGNYT